MSVPARAATGDATSAALASLAPGDPGLLGEGLPVRPEFQDASGLDPRTSALAKIAALIALDAPPASCRWQVANAIGAGATPGEMLGLPRGAAPQAGVPRIAETAPALMAALGLDLPAGPSGMA